jgi:hypothetical protein
LSPPRFTETTDSTSDRALGVRGLENTIAFVVTNPPIAGSDRQWAAGNVKAYIDYRTKKLEEAKLTEKASEKMQIVILN